MSTIVVNREISEVENKVFDPAKYIAIPKFNKLTAENFTARLMQVNLVSRSDFDNKLINFKRKTASNKTKCLEVQKKLNSLITKHYNFSWVELILQVLMDLKTRFYINYTKHRSKQKSIDGLII